jgi:hypothetical protein
MEMGDRPAIARLVQTEPAGEIIFVAEAFQAVAIGRSPELFVSQLTLCSGSRYVMLPRRNAELIGRCSGIPQSSTALEPTPPAAPPQVYNRNTSLCLSDAGESHHNRNPGYSSAVIRERGLERDVVFEPVGGNLCRQRWVPRVVFEFTRGYSS